MAEEHSSEQLRDDVYALGKLLGLGRIAPRFKVADILRVIQDKETWKERLRRLACGGRLQCVNTEIGLFEPVAKEAGSKQERLARRQEALRQIDRRLH